MELEGVNLGDRPKLAHLVAAEFDDERAPARVIVLHEPNSRYRVAVELRQEGENGSTVCSGVAIRASGGSSLFEYWPSRPEAISTREVRRLPLTTYVEAAVAIANTDQAALQRVFRRLGHPPASRSSGWYRDFAAGYRAIVAAGGNPYSQIAAREGVNEALVRQWAKRARDGGHLERSIRATSRRRNRGEDVGGEAAALPDPVEADPTAIDYGGPTVPHPGAEGQRIAKRLEEFFSQGQPAEQEEKP